jgi:hypothetical protein
MDVLIPYWKCAFEIIASLKNDYLAKTTKLEKPTLRRNHCDIRSMELLADS